MESLGVTSDKYAAIRNPQYAAAIPEEILKTWQILKNQKIINEAENPKAENQLNLLMKFLRTEVDSEMHLKLARTGVSGSDNTLFYSPDSSSILKVTELKCFFCNKIGHTKRTCQNYKSRISEQSNKNENIPSKEPDNNEISRNKIESVKFEFRFDRHFSYGVKIK